VLKEKENIDLLFADHLVNYEEDAPSYLWSEIQSNLKKTKRIKRYARIRAIAAVLALLLTFGLGYYSSDVALKKKYDAIYSIPNSRNLAYNSEKSEPDDSSEFTNESKKEITISEKQEKIADNKQEKTTEEKSDNRGILYKLFALSNNSISHDSKHEQNTNQFAFNNKKSREKHSNQLLIDTLLLEKENLPEGGFLIAQRNDKASKWSFGTKFSPVYSLAENSSNGSSVDQSSSLKSARDNSRPNTNAEEKALTAFSGGVNVNYQFAKRWSLESGLFYSQRKQMAENLVSSSLNGYEDELQVYTPQGVKYVQPEFSNVQTNGSDIIGSSRDETYYSLGMNYISNFEYIELPILVRYKIIDRKLGLDVMSGVSTNFLIGNKSSIVQDQNNIWSGQTDDISPMLYNATLGVGLNYNFYRNFSFNLEPTFKYAIPTESSIISRYPYSFAVFAGFTYRFK